MASWLSLTHLESIFQTDWLYNSLLLFGLRNGVLNSSKVDLKMLSLVAWMKSSYSMLLFLVKNNCVSEIMTVTIDWNNLFNSHGDMLHCNFTFWVVDFNTTFTFFMRFKSVFIKLYLNLRRTLLNTAPSSYLLVWFSANSLFSTGRFLSQNKDLSIFHFIFVTLCLHFGSNSILYFSLRLFLWVSILIKDGWRDSSWQSEWERNDEITWN